MPQPRTITRPLYRTRCGPKIRYGMSPPLPPVRRPARVAIMLALAHEIEAAIKRGVGTQASIAMHLGYSRARLSQLLDLLLLAPDLQREVLFVEAVDGRQPFSEHDLRPVVQLRNWGAQRVAFREAARRRASEVPRTRVLRTRAGRYAPGA